MMEKRNFVTSLRTPGGSTGDVDEIVEAGLEAMRGGGGVKRACDEGRRDGRMLAEACRRDEESDRDALMTVR